MSRAMKANRKRWVRAVALVMAGFLLAGAIFSASSALAEESARDRYDLAIDVLWNEQALRVTQTVDYTNRTGRTLDSMMFCVYANILRRQTSVPVEADRFDAAFPEGYAPGGVDFMSVQVDGQDAEWGVQGKDELFLRVECGLAPGEKAVFRFDFYVLLPVCSGAMGVGDLTWRLTNFYPVAAVWDEVLGDFPLGSYTAMNEPLFSDAADYHAAITLPETYALAAPGTVTKTADGEGNVRYEIEAGGIRELSLIFSRKMFEKTGMLDSGVEIRALGNTPGHASALLSETTAAMNRMEEMLGEYPWPALTVVETEYVYDGLSYPGVIQVSKDAIEGGGLTDLMHNLAARQYFGGIVGSNRTTAPWLSEALCSYIALLRHAEESGEKYLEAFNRQVLPALQVTIPGGVTVDSGTERFSSRMEYEIVIADRGAVVLHDLRQAMGEETFLKALREYVRRMSMKNASASDFLSAMKDVSGRDWTEFLYGHMHTIDDLVSEGVEWYE